MARAIKETERRRTIQTEYNEAHGIVPKTIKKDVRDVINITSKDEAAKSAKNKKKLTKAEKEEMIEKLTAEMKAAAKELDFERAAFLRDTIAKMQSKSDKK